MPMSWVQMAQNTCKPTTSAKCKCINNVSYTDESTTKNADVLTLVSGDARFVPILGAVLNKLGAEAVLWLLNATRGGYFAFRCGSNSLLVVEKDTWNWAEEVEGFPADFIEEVPVQSDTL